MDGSWWRVLTKRGPLEKGIANHFSSLALRTPWRVIFNYLQRNSYIYIYLGKLPLLSIYYFKKPKKSFQVRILEWVAIPFLKGSSRPRDWTQVFQTWRQILYHLSHLGSPKKLNIWKKDSWNILWIPEILSANHSQVQSQEHGMTKQHKLGKDCSHVCS